MRKHLRKILVCLILGALGTVAVAWGCVLWSPDQHKGRYIWRDEPGWSEIPQCGPAPIQPDTPLYLTFRPARCGFEERNWWTDDPRMPYGVVSTGRAGWPMHALQYRVSVLVSVPGGKRPDVLAAARADPMSAINWGLPLWRLPEWMRVGRDSRRLPLVPVWLGFAVNTVSCGTVAAGGWYGLRCARGHFRSRSGRCQNCGYDISGIESRCPECGRPGR